MSEVVQHFWLYITPNEQIEKSYIRWTSIPFWLTALSNPSAWICRIKLTPYSSEKMLEQHFLENRIFKQGNRIFKLFTRHDWTILPAHTFIFSGIWRNKYSSHSLVSHSGLKNFILLANITFTRHFYGFYCWQYQSLYFPQSIFV